MAAKQWNFVFEQVLGHEGGFQNMREDRGNWTTGVIGKGENKGTKFGITAMTYPDLDIKNLTVEQAKAIYKRDFWDRLKGDQLPEGLDLAMFDYAVNSGVGQAVEELQTLIGVKVDGRLGPDTLDELDDHDPEKLVAQLCAARLDYMRSQKKNWARFGNGWTTRVQRIARVGRQMVINERREEVGLDEAKTGDIVKGVEVVGQIANKIALAADEILRDKDGGIDRIRLGDRWYARFK